MAWEWARLAAMFATLQLYLALGFGRLALVVDLVLTVAVVATLAIVAVRRARPADAAPFDVVGEAEAVVAGAQGHVPA